jgi:PAS domain S-box-containing protein
MSDQRHLQEALETDVRTLRAQLSQLQASFVRFRQSTIDTFDGVLADVPGHACCTLDADGRILTWSTAATAVHGHPPEAVLGQPLAVLFAPEERPAAVGTLLERSRQMGRAEQEMWLTRQSGSRFRAEVLVTALPDEHAGVGGFLTITHDLTERQRDEAAVRDANVHIEDRVQERTRELRTLAEELGRSNRDLETFAYAASHDLQEPLRAVAGCVQLLRIQYRDQLDAHGAELIMHAIQGAERMRTLIGDLLDYSQVRTRGALFDHVDTDDALKYALLNLQVVIAENHATITSDPLPAVYGDRAQLARVFQNLIGNAIKFRSAARPVIHVSAMPEGRWYKIAVTDNGLGILPAHHQRIFTIFQRLHSRAAYPGTGIGLAICQRIVERHGGRIWVESQPDSGSTFFFTLPADAPSVR